MSCLHSVEIAAHVACLRRQAAGRAREGAEEESEEMTGAIHTMLVSIHHILLGGDNAAYWRNEFESSYIALGGCTAIVPVARKWTNSEKARRNHQDWEVVISSKDSEYGLRMSESRASKIYQFIEQRISTDLSGH